MKRTKWISALIAVAMVTMMLFAGCKKQDVIAAKVGDSEITVSTLENMFASNSAYATYYGVDITTEEGVKAFQDLMMNSLISNEVKVYQAKLAGLTLTEEEETSAKTAAESDYESFFQQYVDAATKNGATDPELTAKTYLTDTLAANGTTVKEVKANFVKSEREEILINKHKDQIEAEVTPTEDEITEMYQGELAAQSVAFAENPATYFTYESYYSYGYTCFPLTIPEGLFYVRQILVEDETVAKDIYDRAVKGEDFEALLKEYNTDPGMDSKPEGYLIGEGANYVDEFLSASLALEKEGDISEPVKSSYGYHIIKRMANATAGAIDYATIKDQYTSYATTLKQTNHYNELVEEWMAGDYVVRYEDAYRSVGMESVVAATAAPEGAETTEDPANADATAAPENAEAAEAPAETVEATAAPAN